MRLLADLSEFVYDHSSHGPLTADATRRRPAAANIAELPTLAAPGLPIIKHVGRISSACPDTASSARFSTRQHNAITRVRRCDPLYNLLLTVWNHWDGRRHTSGIYCMDVFCA